MKLKQKILISVLVIVLPCLTVIGLYVKDYKSTSNAVSVINKEKRHETRSITMMYETETGEYVESSDSTWLTDGYVFNENLSRCENGGELSWNATTNQVIMSSNVCDKCYVYFDRLTFAKYIKSTYKSNESGQTLLYHDGSLNGAKDLSYRYSGASEIVNNYVCFGTTAKPCPVDNLYRIIGIFDDGTGTYRVKLIKYDYATSAQLGTDGDYSNSTYPVLSDSVYKGTQTSINRYRWNYNNNTAINDGNGSNIWSTSLLNRINLNTSYISYLNSLGSEWATKVADTTWQVGGNTYENIVNVTPSVTYQNEIVTPDPGSYGNGETTYTSKIGLMYVSDYGFAASSDSWATALSSYNLTTITQNNWMHMGLYEWTITRCTDTSSISFYVWSAGRVGGDYASNYLAVRPVFYLTSSVELKSGIGSVDSPYRI